MKMRVLGLLALILSVPFSAQAAYISRFDVQMFNPAVDGGDYFTIYDSQTLKAWQGNLGFYVDYSNRPLQFRGAGVVAGRQSIIDHVTTVDLYGALGFTDWFTAGVNIPVVAYNWFFTDDAAALEDHGAGMGDLTFIFKLRAIDIDKHRVGLSFIPFVTAPTGDVVRYQGNGAPTGGMDVVLDWKMHERFAMSLNLGGELRDDVTRNGVRIDDRFRYGLGANFKLSKDWQLIAEAHGTTVMRDFFTSSNSTPIEAGAGFRHFFKDSGFALDFAGYGGLTDGVGSSRFRVVAGLRWTSPAEKEAPPPPPAPEPRIVNNKIVLMGKIFYDTAKATIKPESFPVLDDVVDVLNKNQYVTLVEVQGHTDARGSDAYNMRLSQARAESAMNYLVSHGISSSRLVAKGYGEGSPIASNSTAEGMSQNRRTEFVILNQNLNEGSSVYIPSSTESNTTPSPEPTPVPTTTNYMNSTSQISEGDIDEEQNGQNSTSKASESTQKQPYISPSMKTISFMVSPVNAAPIQQPVQMAIKSPVVSPNSQTKTPVKKPALQQDTVVAPKTSSGGLLPPEGDTRDEVDSDLETLFDADQEETVAAHTP